MTIGSQFASDDGARQNILERARLCAALSKPWILPPVGQTKDAKLPETYQSVGSRGVTNLEGKMLIALYPPGSPWFRLRPAASIRFNPNIAPEIVQQMEQRLYLHELMIQTVLESNNLSTVNNRRRAGFRSRKRMALSQILVTGDCLEQLTDDYRLKIFRRDQYVTKRDSAGDVLYHIIRENIDPMSLADDVKAKAALPDGLDKKAVSARMVDIFTQVEWNPVAKSWVITQEINGKEVNKSEEKISPFFSTPFELAPGEDYGRGFIELNVGDLRSLNELDLKMLDFAALASKQHPVMDYSSLVRDQDLASETGTPFRARVNQGQVQDVAFLKCDKISDFSVVFQTAERKDKALGKAMLMESEVQPKGERVTAYQAQRVALELDGALGGVYAPIADDQQLPLLARTIHRLKADKLLPPLPEKAVEAEALTGIAALSREVDAGKLMTAFQSLAQLPGALDRISIGVAADILMRYTGIFEPGLVKSDEQIAKEREAAIGQAINAEAQSKAIDVAGNAAEHQLTYQA